MHIWISVRVALMLLGAMTSFFVPLGSEAQPAITWFALAVIFVFCLLGLLFVIGILVFLDPLSAKVWRRPSWAINPFNLREPLQFLHLGAYVVLTEGIVILAR